MTPAEHAALSAQLARAIGWGRVLVRDGRCHVGAQHWLGDEFDYRAPDVYGPLIEWLYTERGAVIERESGLFWVSVRPICTMRTIAIANTLHEAVARAVIAVRKGRP